MATFRVPQQHENAPSSVTRPPGGHDLSAANSRRNSESVPGRQPVAAAAPMQPMEVEQPKAPLPMAAAPVMMPMKTTSAVVVAREETRRNRGCCGCGRLCCCLCVFFLLALITMGILIAFLVRTPSVNYDSVELVCPNNDYVTCATTSIQLKVHLTVDNPNIIGATVNAKMNLYKQDGTLIGPGVVDDTSVKAKGNTDVVALFTIPSSNALDVLTALYIPPTSDVVVKVEGRVYVHLGALRPGIPFDKEITIPKQNLGDVTSSLPGGIDAAALAAAIAQVIALRGSSSRAVSVALLNPTRFAQTLLAVGPPESETRRAFVQQMRRDRALRLPQRPLSTA